MNRTRSLKKMLGLALAVAIVVSMMPAISAKAALLGWTPVTSKNKDTMEENLSDVSDLYANGMTDYLDAFAKAYGKNNLQYGERYIIGKKGDQYVYLSSGLYRANLVSSDQIDTDTAAGTYTYYYHPQYTVTFDLGGGSFTGSTTAKTVGGLLTSLPMPTKAGYLFTGWSTTSGAISESAKYLEQNYIYNAPTTIYAHWYQWTGKEEWVRATSMSDLEYANLPVIGNSAGTNYINTYFTPDSLPEDAYQVVFGYFYSYGVNYWLTSKSSADSSGKLHSSFYLSNDTLEERLQEKVIYVYKDPSAVAPVTPTPAPATPTPAPATSEPVTGDSGNSSSESVSTALKTTNIAGEQISGWKDITKAISTQTKDKQQSVSGANQDLLHVDASGFNKTIPDATVKEVSSSALRGLHVFIGDGDAITFLTKNDLSDYKETNFEHKDTITDHARTIDFTYKQELGATVVFHTTVPAKLSEVTVYKVDTDNKKIRIVKTTSNANGQVCFQITETATYILEY